MENTSEWLGTIAIKDWMDAVVESRQRERQLRRYGNQVLLLGVSDDIHVCSRIGEMASAAGATLEEESMEGKFPYRYSFMYKGFRFFQISEERLGDMGEGDRNGGNGCTRT